MATVGSSSVHNKLVETVKSHNSEVVSRADQVRINLGRDVVYSSWKHGILHSLGQELNVCNLLVVWHVRANDWNVSVV